VPEPVRNSPDAERLHGFRELGYAPDGQHYSVVEGNQVFIVEAASGKIIFNGSGRWVTAAWLDAGRLIFGHHTYSGLEQKGPNTWEEAAWIYDLAARTTTPLPPRYLTGPFAVSEDGRRLALVRDGTGIQVFSVADGFDGEPELKLSPSMPGLVKGITFSADGGHLSAYWQGGASWAAGVFDLAGKRQIFDQRWPVVSAVALCPDQPLLVMAGRDPWLMTYRFLEPRPQHGSFDDGEPVGNPYVPGGPFNPPQRLLTRATQSGGTGFLFGHEAAPHDPVFLRGKKALVTASDDGTVRRWPLTSRVPARQRRNFVDSIYPWFHPAASLDGSHILYRMKTDGRYRQWHRAAGLRTEFPADQTGLAAFNDGRTLMRVSETGEVVCYETHPAPDNEASSLTELWRAPGGPSIQGFHQIIRSAVSRDERRVAVLQPGKLLVVDMDTQTTRDTPDQVMLHGNIPGQCVDLSPDGQTIAVTGFIGRRARLYSAADLTVEPVKLVPTDDPTPHDSACAFSRDGARLFVANEDGWVRVFDTATRKELPAERWKAHTTEITALVVSQAGGIVAFWSAEAS